MPAGGWSAAIALLQAPPHRCAAVLWLNPVIRSSSRSPNRSANTVSGGTIARVPGRRSAACRRGRARSGAARCPPGPATSPATVAASLPRSGTPSTASTTSPGRTPAIAAGPSATAPRTRTAPPRCASVMPSAGGAVAPGPVLRRLARRDVARIGVEVVEQLVEEALDDALRAGAPHRGRCAATAAVDSRTAAAAHASGASPAGSGCSASRRSRRRQHQLAVAVAPAVRFGSSAVRPRRPQTVSVGTGTGSSVRGCHEGERGGIDVGDQRRDRIRHWRPAARAPARAAAAAAATAEGRFTCGADRFPGCCVRPARHGRPGRR